MNNVMLPKPVETQKSKKIPLINSDDTDLQVGIPKANLTADQHGLARIRKKNTEILPRKAVHASPIKVRPMKKDEFGLHPCGSV